MAEPGSPRRAFIKKGLVGGALLILAGALPVGLRGTRRGSPPRRPLRLLTPDEFAILAAVAARVVPGDGAGPEWPTAEAVDCAGKIDELMSRTHPAMGADFRRLLHLVENALTGLALGHGPRTFTGSAPAEQAARFDAWRTSRVAVLRSGYQALVRLCHAAYFSSPEVHPRIGYGGPPVVPGQPVVPGSPG